MESTRPTFRSSNGVGDPPPLEGNIDYSPFTTEDWKEMARRTDERMG